MNLIKSALAAAFVSLLILSACNSADMAHCNKRLSPSDSTISIPVGPREVSTSRNIRFFEDHGREYLAVENNILMQINVYDIKNLSHVKCITPQREGPNGIGRMSGFDIVNFDSIYISSEGYGFTICMIDSSATLRNKNRIEVKCPRPYFAFPELWSSYGGNVIQTSGGTFFPKELRDEDQYFYSLHKYSLGYLSNGASDLCLDYKVNFPDVSKATPQVFNYPCNTIICNGKHIINFIRGHQIFSLEDTVWTAHIARSAYFTSDLSPLTESKTITESMTKYAKTPCYPVLIWDSYRNVFYRFAYPGVEVKESDNMVEMGEFRKLFSVMVLDGELNVMSETLMPENTYNINMFFVNEAGLWISTNHVENPAFDEDALNFQLFTLE